MTYIYNIYLFIYILLSPLSKEIDLGWGCCSAGCVLCTCLHEVLDLIPRQRKKVHLGLLFVNWHIFTVKTWQRGLSGDVMKSALCSTLKRCLKVLELFFSNRDGLYNFH